jgi:hypothetical protein
VASIFHAVALSLSSFSQAPMRDKPYLYNVTLIHHCSDNDPRRVCKEAR